LPGNPGLQKPKGTGDRGKMSGGVTCSVMSGYTVLYNLAYRRIARVRGQYSPQRYPKMHI